MDTKMEAVGRRLAAPCRPGIGAAPDEKVALGLPLKEIPSWLVAGTLRPSAGRFTFSTWKFYQKDSPLLESGLLGPVELLVITP
jgi:hypothetical protein